MNSSLTARIQDLVKELAGTEIGSNAPQGDLERAIGSVVSSRSPEENVQIAELFLQHQSREDSRYLECLLQVSQHLHAQYLETNEWELNERAIEYLGNEIAETSADESAAVGRLSLMYSRCMRARFLRGRNEKDLEQATQFGEIALENTGGADAAQTEALLAERRNNMSLCYFTAAHQIDDTKPEVFQQALELSNKALASMEKLGTDTALLLEILSTNGLILQVSYDRSLNIEDLEKSLDLSLRMKELVEYDPREQHEWSANYAFRLLRAFGHWAEHGQGTNTRYLHRGRSLRDDALAAISNAMEIDLENSLMKLDNAITFVYGVEDLPREEQRPALGACFGFLSKAVDILVLNAEIQTAADQIDSLSTYYGLSRYAAAAALQAGEDPFVAVTLLEKGRLVAQSLRQDDMEDSEQTVELNDPLLHEYYGKKKALQLAVTQCELYSLRLKLQAELHALRHQIRSIKGYNSFDGLITREQALRLAADEDIIIINVCSLRCDAIVITGHEVKFVSLPNANEEFLSEQSWAVQTAIAQDFEAKDRFHELWEGLYRSLSYLWDSVVEPPLNCLGHTSPLGLDDANWPHVRWILTGCLTLFPIHAAGKGLRSKKNVLNRVVSSYASSLKSLLRAQKSLSLLSGSDVSSAAASPYLAARVLALIMPKTATHSDLELSIVEEKIVRNAFPQATTIVNATGAEVLEGLRKRPHLVHFSCHGEADYEKPSQTRLLFRDWEETPLTVAKIRSELVKGCGLAFLSACFTGASGIENVQDEAENVVNALQSAGFCSVIGSLWYVGESAALDVVREFYKYFARKEQGFELKRAADALHFAILKFQQKTKTAGNSMKGNPVAWAPFVHFGV